MSFEIEWSCCCLGTVATRALPARRLGLSLHQALAFSRAIHLQVECEDKMSNTIVLATMETRHFSFKAAGATKEEADKGLLDAWRAHAVQAKAQSSVQLTAVRIKALDDQYGIRYETMTLGQGYRDGASLPK